MGKERKISVYEYKRALKTVEQYHNQQSKRNTKGEYHFLYWLNSAQWHVSNNEDSRWKIIKAKDIDSAIRKFVRTMPVSLQRVDYEVGFEDTFIDISERKELKEYI